MKSLNGRVAVITGAGGGLGRALAVELSSHGCHLALVDVNASAVEQTAKAVFDRRVRVEPYTLPSARDRPPAGRPSEETEQ